MTIVFAENFKNDTVASIVQKYPGSVRAATPSSALWPWETGNYLRLETLPTTGFNHVEFYMTFDGFAAGTTTTTNLFGLVMYPRATGDIVVGGQVTTPIIAPDEWHTLEWLHIVFEKASEYQWVGYVYCNTGKARIVTGARTWTNIAIFGSCYFPQNLTGLVISHQEEVTGKRMSSIIIEEALLSADNQGSWAYSDAGFVEDVDKDDPQLKTPNVSSPDEGILGYAPIEEYDFVQWTVSSFDDNLEPKVLEYNSSQVATAYEPKSRMIVGADLLLKFRDPEFVIAAQPDWSRREAGPAYYESIQWDDYSLNNWNVSSEAVFGGAYPPPYPGMGVLRAHNAFTTTSPRASLVLPTGFGTRPFCLRVWQNWGTVALSGTIYNVAWSIGALNFQVANRNAVYLLDSIIPYVSGFSLYEICYEPVTSSTGQVWAYSNGAQVVAPKTMSIGTMNSLNLVYKLTTGTTTTTADVSALQLLDGSSVYDSSQTTIPFDANAKFPLP